MNREQRLKRAEKLLQLAEDNPTASSAKIWVEMANTHIRLANAGESMNVLTDKELAQAKKNVQTIKAAGEIATEMISFGGELETAGRLLYNKLYYS